MEKRKSYILGQKIQYASTGYGRQSSKAILLKRPKVCSWSSALCQVTVCHANKDWTKSQAASLEGTQVSRNRETIASLYSVGPQVEDYQFYQKRISLHREASSIGKSLDQKTSQVILIWLLRLWRHRVRIWMAWGTDFKSSASHIW